MLLGTASVQANRDCRTTVWQRQLDKRRVSLGKRLITNLGAITAIAVPFVDVRPTPPGPFCFGEHKMGRGEQQHDRLNFFAPFAFLN